VKSSAGNPATGHPGTLRAAAALICLLAAAGCASPGNSATATPPSPNAASGSPGATGSTPGQAPSPTGSPPATAAAACPTSTLRVKLGAAEGYAGGVYQVIEFTNGSNAPCTLYGYPGVSLVTGPPYAQVGLPAKRTSTAPVKLVTLDPGRSGTAVLQIVDALNYPASTCQPVKATNLKVYPPNQTVPVYLPSTSNGCAKPVQTLFISAVQASGEAHPMPGAGGESS
jgi:Domain of unknown function (DUF4232)